ncbi:MAG: hypothetical protein QOH66_1808 [Actinomycetota bacterium]|nr:hypothetical protein [Actinomycetota bacterium]
MVMDGNQGGILASKAVKRIASKPKCPGHGPPGTVIRATSRLTAGVALVAKCCATVSERRLVRGACPARAKSARARAAPWATCGGCELRIRRVAEVSQRQSVSLSALTASVNCLAQAISGSWSASSAAVPAPRVAFMTRNTIRTR